MSVEKPKIFRVICYRTQKAGNPYISEDQNRYCINNNYNDYWIMKWLVISSLQLFYQSINRCSLTPQHCLLSLPSSSEPPLPSPPPLSPSYKLRLSPVYTTLSPGMPAFPAPLPESLCDGASDGFPSEPSACWVMPPLLHLLCVCVCSPPAVRRVWSCHILCQSSTREIV